MAVKTFCDAVEVRLERSTDRAIEDDPLRIEHPHDGDDGEGEVVHQLVDDGRRDRVALVRGFEYGLGGHGATAQRRRGVHPTGQGRLGLPRDRRTGCELLEPSDPSFRGPLELVSGKDEEPDLTGRVVATLEESAIGDDAGADTRTDRDRHEVPDVAAG